MAQEFKKHESNIFNAIVERPVDIFYGDMTQIISLSFKDLPEIFCASNEAWENFLRNTWDQHFPEIDNILDFLRHCVYHTGLAGRFYKINCVLSLDDVIFLLKDRLPNPDVSLKVWHKLNKIGSLILKEKCKESAANISVVLDLHISTNSICDNSEEWIKFLNLEAIPTEERLLIYHITICYDINDKPTLANLSNLNSFTNIKECFTDFDEKPEISKIPKSTTSKNQSDSFFKPPTDSNDADQWQKYGARPKNKLYSVKKCSNAIENKQKLNEFSESSSNSYSGVENSKKLDSSWAAKKLCREVSKRGKINALKNSAAESKESSDHKKTFAERRAQFFHKRNAPLEVEKYRRVHQESEQELFWSQTSSRILCKLPVSEPNDEKEKKPLRLKYKPLLDTQENTSLQLPFISIESQNILENVAVNDTGNSNFGMDVLESYFQVRESLLREEIKRFFENYKFSDVRLDDMPSVPVRDKNLVKELCSSLPPIDLQSNSELFIDPKNFLAEISNATVPATGLSRNDDDSGHLAIKNFVDKISFNWENLLKTDIPFMENSNPIALKEIPAEKAENFSKNNNKDIFLDGKNISSPSVDFYGIFFKDIIQQLTEDGPFAQKVSQESLPPSTHRTHSTPEKKSKLTSFEKLNDEINSQESVNEKVLEHSDESLKLSDFDNTPESDSFSDVE